MSRHLSSSSSIRMSLLTPQALPQLALPSQLVSVKEQVSRLRSTNARLSNALRAAQARETSLTKHLLLLNESKTRSEQRLQRTMNERENLRIEVERMKLHYAESGLVDHREHHNRGSQTESVATSTRSSAHRSSRPSQIPRLNLARSHNTRSPNIGSNFSVQSSPLPERRIHDQDRILLQEIENLRTQNVSLRTDITTSRTTAHNQDETINELKDQLRTSKTQTNNQQEQLIKATQAISNLEAKHTSLAARAHHLNTRLADTERALTTQLAENDRLGTLIAQQDAQLESANETIGDVQEDLREIIEESQRRLADAMQEHMLLEVERDAATAKARSYEREIGGLVKANYALEAIIGSGDETTAAKNRSVSVGVSGVMEQDRRELMSKRLRDVKATLNDIVWSLLETRSSPPTLQPRASMSSPTSTNGLKMRRSSIGSSRSSIDAFNDYRTHEDESENIPCPTSSPPAATLALSSCIRVAKRKGLRVYPPSWNSSGTTTVSGRDLNQQPSDPMAESRNAFSLPRQKQLMRIVGSDNNIDISELEHVEEASVVEESQRSSHISAIDGLGITKSRFSEYSSPGRGNSIILKGSRVGSALASINDNSYDHDDDGDDSSLAESDTETGPTESRIISAIVRRLPSASSASSAAEYGADADCGLGNELLERIYDLAASPATASLVEVDRMTTEHSSPKLIDIGPLQPRVESPSLSPSPPPSPIPTPIMSSAVMPLISAPVRYEDLLPPVTTTTTMTTPRGNEEPKTAVIVHHIELDKKRRLKQKGNGGGTGGKFGFFTSMMKKIKTIGR